jgi:hypothetical protein
MLNYQRVMLFLKLQVAGWNGRLPHCRRATSATQAAATAATELGPDRFLSVFSHKHAINPLEDPKFQIGSLLPHVH